MLLHLPIVILAMLSPIHECRYDGGSAANVQRCSQDETVALGQLKAEWLQFVGADKRPCMDTTQIGGFASYVELLTCLEMARDVASPKTSPDDSQAKSGLRPTQAGRRGLTIGEAQ
jgi:hypothetical protein